MARPVPVSCRIVGMTAAGNGDAGRLDPVLEEALQQLRAFTYRRRRLQTTATPRRRPRPSRSQLAVLREYIRLTAHVRLEDRDRSLADPSAAPEPSTSSSTSSITATPGTPKRSRLGHHPRLHRRGRPTARRVRARRQGRNAVPYAARSLRSARHHPLARGRRETPGRICGGKWVTTTVGDDPLLVRREYLLANRRLYLVLSRSPGRTTIRE
jgi:hypothetical protein